MIVMCSHILVMWLALALPKDAQERAAVAALVQEQDALAETLGCPWTSLCAQ